MKHVAVAAVVFAIVVSGASANILPAGKGCKEFMVGVTGIHAEMDTQGVLSVTKVTPGTPAEGRLKTGDVLLAVDGRTLRVQDPRHPLGFAINAAEGRDGNMTFDITRDGTKQTVTIPLEATGRYSPTWPAHCKKSRRIVDATAAFILKNGGPCGGIPGNLEALFLLSTGERKYMPAIEKYAVKLASKGCGHSTWGIGYSGIFLGEYYLATGDKRVLGALKARCDELARGQYYGGWGHGTKHCGPGYVTGGLLNAAGDQALTTLIIARECGVDVPRKTYNDALKFFFRFAGRGGVPYGDHHPELWAASNGKNGGLASALTLLPGKKFQAGAQLLALSETNSYYSTEGGHGSTFGNLTWRNVVDVLVPEAHTKAYRRHKDKLIWHFDLSRMPGGGFKAPYYPGYGPIGRAPTYQTGMIAMAYTAHLKNLRICGKPRTKYSTQHKPTAVELALETDDFHRTDWVDGVVIDMDPDKIFDVFTKLYDASGKVMGTSHKAGVNDKRKKKMPAQWYFKMMHHYQPTIRVWAANALGFQGADAIGPIKKALAGKDGRLRVAGLNAISGATGWAPGKTKTKITPETIEKHFLPQILGTLKDPKAHTWEKRHALMAMSCCDAETVAANADAIEPYLNDKEWWLRTAAFVAFQPLIPDAGKLRPLLPDMLASYHADTNLPSRRWGATTLFRKAIAANPDIRAEIVAGMAASIKRTPVRDGFKRPIDLNNIFETLRYVDMKKHPEHVIPLLPAMVRIFPKLEGWPGIWLFTGARWGNIGLVKASAALGKDAKPVVAAMKTMLPELKTRPRADKRQTKQYKDTVAAVEKAIADYEARYGQVKVGG